MKTETPTAVGSGALLGGGKNTKFTFSEHKERTAADCEFVAKQLTELASTIRAGNMKAFEKFWMEGGTEEGDAEIQSVRERIVLRFLYREEKAA